MSKVRIAACWEIGYQAPITEWSLWNHPLKEFDVSHVLMFPVSGIMSGLEQSFLSETAQFDVELEKYRLEGSTIVHVDEAGYQDLKEFKHPDDVVYCFGRSSLSTFRAYSKPGDQSVKISTVVNQAGLWAHQAASIVLYDRYLKSQ